MAYGEPTPTSDSWGRGGLDIGRAYVYPYPAGTTTSYLYQYRLTDDDITAIADKVVAKLLASGAMVTAAILRPDEV